MREIDKLVAQTKQGPKSIFQSPEKEFGNEILEKLEKRKKM